MDCTLTLESCHLQKCSDLRHLQLWGGRQETENRELVDRFDAWCGNDPLVLSVPKTKEMVVNFKRTRVELHTISGRRGRGGGGL